ncbi:unnamed protein product [Prunus armeniaca]|uniref:EGF-like domain-containing protein n=1 Tax=Prunus armeniaca TaxID=36596 RepID=A0A6J5U8Z8_PRUAR|nr:unnamed protein product [Prunus armeniaca]
MGAFNFNLNLISFLLLLALFTLYPTTIISTQLSSPNSLGDIECQYINCGEGVCKASNETLLGFDCECNPGWIKIHVGLLTLPTCVPNCTINFQCDESPSPPAPPAPLIPPKGCALVWCGDGTCVTNGSGYACQCPQGSWNLLDVPSFACFKPFTLFFSKPYFRLSWRRLQEQGIQFAGIVKYSYLSKKPYIM